LAVLPGQLTAFFSLAFSPDGKRLAGGGEGIIQLWDLTSRPPQDVGAIHCPNEIVSQLAFTPDGASLVSTDGATLRAWRAPALAAIR